MPYRPNNCINTGPIPPQANEMKIAIVTDSTADIPDELSTSLSIHVVPNLVIMDGRSYEDGNEISRQDFYERLPSMKVTPTTSAAPYGKYRQTYYRLIKQGFQNIISIHAPSQLSGIYNAASTAAREFGERVHVLDSGSATLGLGFQVLAAAEAVAHGATPRAILDVIDNMRRRVHVIALLETMEYVRRSGRVSWARARLGNLLQIKPLVELRGGQVLSMGESRTRRKGIQRLRELLHRLGKLERLAILHTNAEADARQFMEEFISGLPTEPLVVNVTTVIGTHVGPNGLGFAAVVK
jgi:DegV family protein with EDD domain